MRYTPPPAAPKRSRGTHAATIAVILCIIIVCVLLAMRAAAKEDAAKFPCTVTSPGCVPIAKQSRYDLLTRVAPETLVPPVRADFYDSKCFDAALQTYLIHGDWASDVDGQPTYPEMEDCLARNASLDASHQ